MLEFLNILTPAIVFLVTVDFGVILGQRTSAENDMCMYTFHVPQYGNEMTCRVDQEVDNQLKSFKIQMLELMLSPDQKRKIEDVETTIKLMQKHLRAQQDKIDFLEHTILEMILNETLTVNQEGSGGKSPRVEDHTRNISLPGAGSCPKPESGSLYDLPPHCCSFPFTYNKNLHYQCTPAPDGFLGCLVNNRTWATCAEPTDFIALNQTVSVSIPRVVRFIATSVHGWIVFQQRIDGTVSFNRSWEDFKTGFGRPDGNFWLGLEKVHKLTASAPHKLRIEFRMRNGSWHSVEYETFRVWNETAFYKIEVSGFTGDTVDIMNIGGKTAPGCHNGVSFTTYDRDNAPNGGNCAISYSGGWWYNRCYDLNLNGQYGSHFSIDFFGNEEYIQLSVSRMMMKKL